MLTREFGNAKAQVAARWRDYYQLTKPGVVQLLVFTAVVGMFLATPGMVPWQALVFGSLGIVAAQGGDIPGARELWTKSRDLYARIGAKHMVEKVQGWLDELPEGGDDGR
jgi:hypothetical protein